VDRQAEYRIHLKEKTRSLHAGLDLLGYASCRPRIHAAPLEDGFRSRAKFKIFTGDGAARVCGTDPRCGEVSLEGMLWILPAWARGVVVQLQEALLSAQGEFPVDGSELKLAHGRQEAHLTLSVRKGRGPSYEPLAAQLLSGFREIRGVAVPSRRESFGEEWIRNRINGLECMAHYSAFFQSHPGLTPRLLRELREVLGGYQGRRIIDLYCGVGLLSLSLALHHTPILGVDSHSGAVDSAVRNAVLLGSLHARFVCSSVESHIASLDIRPEDLMLLDPPRSGCPAEVIRAIAGRGPREVCLISCCPQTQFRDLSIWGASGYSLRRMSALDMFPFTEFLETVALLEKQS